MKNAVFYILGIVSVGLFLTAPKSDIGKLHPVKLVQVTTCSGNVHLRTDTGLFGEGADFDLALEDLYRTTPGMPYLETADYLLITPATARYLPELKRLLRPGTEVARMSCMVDGESAAEFLDAHSPGLTLLRTEEIDRIPRLVTVGERYELEGV